MRLFHFIFILVFGFALPATADSFGEQLAEAALGRTQHEVLYDGSYQRMAYPGGDVPATQGVCTDVVIRAYRQMGVDLQVKVHEDMAAHFSAYPAFWGLKRTDTNIDHRRVPNLQTFFTRQGTKINHKDASSVFQTGDVLTWMLPGNLPHTGIVVASASDRQPAQVVHNFGAGPIKTDMPSNWVLTGQYRYNGK